VFERELVLELVWDAWGKIGAWRDHYSTRRPHSQLGYRTPEEFARNLAFLVESSAMSSAALGVSVHKRRARTRLGRTGPIRATVFAQDAPYKENDGENDPLNGWRRDRK
jgi:hypothetical protein